MLTFLFGVSNILCGQRSNGHNGIDARDAAAECLSIEDSRRREGSFIRRLSIQSDSIGVPRDGMWVKAEQVTRGIYRSKAAAEGARFALLEVSARAKDAVEISPRGRAALVSWRRCHLAFWMLPALDRAT